MFLNIHPKGIIWVPNSSTLPWSLDRKRNDDIAVQYEDVHEQANNKLKIILGLVTTEQCA